MKVDVNNGPPKKLAKFGPHFPTFVWSTQFPSARIVYIDNEDTASDFIPVFLNELWKRALNEGEVAVGFDVEWKPNRNGKFSMMLQ